MPGSLTKTVFEARWKVLIVYIILIALLAYALHYHGDLIVVRIISYVLYLIAAMNFVMTLYQFSSFWHFGQLNAEQKRTVRELNSVAANTMVLYSTAEVLLLGVAAIIFSFFNDFDLLPLGLWILSTYMTRTLRMNQPPLVLLLTTSSKEGYQLAVEVQGAIHPHRLASLLITRGRRFNPFLKRVFQETTWRTIDNDIWNESIRDILPITQIVVLDARHVTQAIIEEAKLCLSMEFLYKVVIVLGADDKAPVLTHVQDDRGFVTKLVNEAGVKQEDIWGVLWYNVRWLKKLPTKNHPMQECLKELPVEWRYTSKYAKDGQHIPLGPRNN